MHCGLLVLKQPYRKQGPGNHRDEYKCKHYQYISKYASVHIHRRHTGSNTRSHTPAKAEDIYNRGLTKLGDEVECSMKQYWPIRSKLAISDDIAMKGKRIIIPFLLQKQIIQ